MQNTNRTNLAYDLSMFETREKPVLKPAPQISVLPNPKAKVGSVIKCLFYAAVAFGLLFALISNKVEMAELNYAINAQNLALTEVVKENDRLQAQLDSKITLKAIEEKATTDLGLQKATRSQVEYLKTSSIQTIVVNDTSSGNDVLENMKKFFDSTLEYLGF